jgi:O-antigen/teichoic acid export membrane protein
LLQKIRELSKNLAIYGLGDVAISVVSFLLLPLYVQYLSAGDYGALRLLGSVEVIAKIFFRWGLDGSFMRFYYEAETAAERQRLASTIFFFLLAVNGILVIAALAAAPVLASWLFGGAPYLRALQLTLANTFLIGFTFFPFHLLRIEKRAAQFSALTLARSLSTLVLRLVLIVGYGFGVLGIVVADVVVTVALMGMLVPWFAPLLRPVFSKDVLRATLRFGLPRVPHAAAQQVIAVGDSFILKAFRPLQEVGVYSMGVSFGLTLKLFLSAFEYAWAPFYYANAREPDAARLFSSMTTYGLAVLALMTAVLSACGRDVLAGLDLFSARSGETIRYAAAGEVVTWTAVGVLLQGFYLLTSIGLNITKNTQYYPVATVSAAATNIALNIALVPRFGMIGAAWANAAGYGVQAVLAFRFSQRFFPVRYETQRIALISGAALVACLIARALPEMPPAVAVAVRALAVLVVYATVLGVSGFLRPEELRALARLRRREPKVAGAGGPEVTELGGEIVAMEVAPEVRTGAIAGERRP